MSEKQYYFGYGISDELYHSCVKTIKDVSSSTDTGWLNRCAASNLERLTDEGFVTYYERPAAMIPMSSLLRKTADAGVHTIQKGIRVVIHKIFSDTSIAQLQTMSDYMGNMLCTSATGSYYLCFPLPRELFELSQVLLKRVREDSAVDSYRNQIVEALERLIDTGIEFYYRAPVAQVNLGRFTRAASDLGIKTVQKAANTVVHKIFHSMTHDQMIPLAAYFESLLHDEVTSWNERT